MSQVAEATLEDLYLEPGKAELIDGRIVRYMPVGHRPNRVAGRIFRSIDDHAERIAKGVAYTDNMGFAVPRLRSGRQSFSPDASYYAGVIPHDDMRFVAAPPALAVEVRSKGDYGDAADELIAAKRRDYFEAGTLVVWDVDPVDECIRVYRSSEPESPTLYRRGQQAEAEPAVPGWSVEVDRLFAK